MNKRISSILRAILALFVLAVANVDVRAAETSAGRKVSLEQTQGDVRVVLLRAGAITSPTNQDSVEVTYVVEIPLKGAFSDLSFGSDEVTLTANGKPLNVSRQVTGSAMGFDKLPRQNELIKPVVRSGKAMIAEEVLFEGVNVRSKKVNVKIQFSWRGQPFTFTFKDLTLR
jgi:hypothetical protein